MKEYAAGSGLVVVSAEYLAADAFDVCAELQRLREWEANGICQPDKITKIGTLILSEAAQLILSAVVSETDLDFDSAESIEEYQDDHRDIPKELLEILELTNRAFLDIVHADITRSSYLDYIFSHYFFFGGYNHNRDPVHIDFPRTPPERLIAQYLCTLLGPSTRYVKEDTGGEPLGPDKFNDDGALIDCDTYTLSYMQPETGDIYRSIGQADPHALPLIAPGLVIPRLFQKATCLPDLTT